MLIRLTKPIGGQFHNYWDVHAGDVVQVDDTDAVRYCAHGLAEVVGKVHTIETFWKSKVPAGDTACRRCSTPITPGEDWHVRHRDVPGAGPLWHRPEHTHCAA